jgi:PII-like signaling protein
MLEIFLADGRRFGERPVYEAIVRRLQELDVAGVTVETGAHITIIDTDEAVDRVIDHIAPLVGRGALATSTVEILKCAC